MQGSHKKCNLYSRRATSGWQCTSLILSLVDHDVKINEAYYRNVMLLQQFLPAVHQILKQVLPLSTKQSPAHIALRQSPFFPVTLTDIERF